MQTAPEIRGGWFLLFNHKKTCPKTGFIFIKVRTD